MRVGKPHGLDGSFYVDIGGRSPFLHASERKGSVPFYEGAGVEIAGERYEVVGRKGTDAKPIIRLSGVEDRDAAEALRGQPISTSNEQPEASDDEWLIDDLIGCTIEGIGEVTAVLEGMSCDVLEAGGELIPLVTDAVKRVDVENGVIEVDRGFLGL